MSLTVSDDTLADEAADHLVTLHRSGDLNLHDHPTLREFVKAWFGGFEADASDDADRATVRAAEYGTTVPAHDLGDDK